MSKNNIKMKASHKIHKRVKVTSSLQYNIMVKFMVDNPTFATYEMVTNEKDKVKYNSLWETLSVQLNKVGPPIRNRLEWKKVWVDYKHYIKKKCYINQCLENNLNTSGIENTQEVKFRRNELAIKKLIFDASINLSTVSNTTPLISDALYNTSPTTTTTQNQEEILIFKTELSDMFIDVADPTELLIDTISPPASSINFEMLPTSAHASNQLTLLEEQAEIEKQLEKIKKEKLKILRQTVDIKERLQEKLQELKERKFELKCQQFKYKAQKLELKKKVLQMKEICNYDNK